MGCGKSFFGQALSSLLNIKNIDLDFFIESIEKKRIDEIFKENGEAYFRNKERQIQR